MLMDNRNIEPINKDVIPEPDHDQANNYAQRDIQNKAQSTYPSLRSTGGKELEFLVEKQTKLLNKKLSTIIIYFFTIIVLVFTYFSCKYKR